MNNPYINEYGTKFYKNTKGRPHRIDGPACEWADGYKEWYVNGKCHRIDGPASQGVDGSKYWYLNGQRYRLDGPAVEGANGYKVWYLNYINISTIKNLLTLLDA